MKKAVDSINYEIEYVLRPRTAPFREKAGPPRLRTSARAGRSHSLEQCERNKAISCGGGGFPRITGRRSRSPHPRSPNGVVPVLKKTNKSQERGKTSRNIEVVTFKVNPSNKENEPRPQTAPQSIYRSPTHPNYKEEEYIQSKIVLRYDGPGEGARDQVKVHQQPKGTYTLPVFKGLLSVGGTQLHLLSLH